MKGNANANIIVFDTGHNATIAYFYLLTIKNEESALDFSDGFIETHLELKNMGIDDTILSKKYPLPK